jgi:hypothetical protein
MAESTVGSAGRIFISYRRDETAYPAGWLFAQHFGPAQIVATGTVVDIGELNEQKDSVTLDPQGRPLVYLVNDACGVQVSPG